MSERQIQVQLSKRETTYDGRWRVGDKAEYHDGSNWCSVTVEGILDSDDLTLDLVTADNYGKTYILNVQKLRKATT